MVEYEFIIDPRKPYKIAVFLLKNQTEAKKFLKEEFEDLIWEDDGVGFFIPLQDYKNKKYIGAIFFDKEHTDIGTIQHEVLHATLEYIKYVKKHNIFKDEKLEEHFVYLTEVLTAKICKAFKITRISIPNEKYLDKWFKESAKQIGF